MELMLDEETRKRANLRVLQRFDRNAVDIVGTASHVVLYEFDQTANQWEKRNVEGSLFVTKRSVRPNYQIFVLNRTSTENLEVAISSTFQMQVMEPYLIFRDGPATHGLWFHDHSERTNIAELLGRIVRNSKESEDDEAESILAKLGIQKNNFDDGFDEITKGTKAIAADRKEAAEALPLLPPVQSMQQNIQLQQQQQQHQLLQKQQMHTQQHDQMHKQRPHPNMPPLPQTLQQQKQPNLTPPLSQTLQQQNAPNMPPFSQTLQQQKSTSMPSLTQTLQQQNTQNMPPLPQTLLPMQNQPPQQIQSQRSSQPNNLILDKKSLQLSLLSLIQDERFIDLIHAQYLKVAHARANRDRCVSSSSSSPKVQPFPNERS